jgi:hypothetical protein
LVSARINGPPAGWPPPERITRELTTAVPVDPDR